MYLGLALLPWVLLYGSSALFFNHATWGNDNTRQDLSADDVAGSWTAAFPAPADLAREAVDRLGALVEEDDLQLVEGSAVWTGRLQYRGRSGDQAVRLLLDPQGGGGFVRRAPDREEDRLPDWADEDSLEGWRPLDEEARATLDAPPAGLDAPPFSETGSLRLRGLPDVTFQLTDGQRDYHCELGMNGQIEVTPLDDVTNLRTRLTELHKQHVDPGSAGARQRWIWIVDIMAGSMLLWALSGVVMWWGIRSTRRAGFVALASGALAMAVLATGVWHAMGIG